jgi:hypothetical protein
VRYDPEKGAPLSDNCVASFSQYAYDLASKVFGYACEPLIVAINV